MAKKDIVKFLDGNKRGVYYLIVEMYFEVISSSALPMALQIIREDLEKESGVNVDLKYFSLAKAVYRFKKKTKFKSNAVIRKREFKDANELTDSQTAPGKFKIV